MTKRLLASGTIRLLRDEITNSTINQNIYTEFELFDSYPHFYLPDSLTNGFSESLLALEQERLLSVVIFPAIYLFMKKRR